MNDEEKTPRVEAAPHRLVEATIELGPVSVLGGEGILVNVRPQMIFKPKRLVIGKDAAPHFVVVDVTVAGRSQFKSPAPVPALVFTDDVDSSFEMKTCRPDESISVLVTNTSSEPHEFTGKICGVGV